MQDPKDNSQSYPLRTDGIRVKNVQGIIIKKVDGSEITEEEASIIVEVFKDVQIEDETN